MASSDRNQIRQQILNLDKEIELHCYSWKEKHNIYVSCPRCQLNVSVYNFFQHTQSKRCNKIKSKKEN